MSYSEFESIYNNSLNKNNKFIIFPPGDNENISFIISKYNESIPSKIFDTKHLYIYDKNPISSENFYKHINKNIKYEHLQNVGRCDHTYLYHIIKNYDNLNDINFFIPASTFICDDLHIFKLEILNKYFIINRESNDTVFFKNIQDIPLLMMFNNFKISGHSTSTESNRLFKEDKLKTCDFTYNEWYIENFGHRNVYYGSFGSILCLHKRHILQHPKKYYENLIKYLDKYDSPEEGHFFERGWGAVFYPIEEDCLYLYKDYNYDINII